MTTNLYETEARLVKARKILAVIEAVEADQSIEIKSETLIDDDALWQKLAFLAQVKPPSPNTRAVVRHMLDYREASRYQPADPFEGLG